MTNGLNNFVTYEQYELNKEMTINFFKMIKDFGELDYDERVEYIKKKYGKIEEKTIKIGKNCRLVISLTNDEKYHFDFECSNAALMDFNKVFPDLTELMMNNSEEEINELYPNMKYELYNLDDNANET